MKRKLFVTVEVTHPVQVMNEIEKITTAPVDGVFLVNSETHVCAEDLFLIAQRMKHHFSRLFIGVIPLRKATIQIAHHATNFRNHIDAVWLKSVLVYREQGIFSLSPRMKGALDELRREKIQTFGSFVIRKEKLSEQDMKTALAVAAQFDVVVADCQAGSGEAIPQLYRAIEFSPKPKPLAVSYNQKQASGLTTQYSVHANAHIIDSVSFIDNKDFFQAKEKIV